MIKENYHLMQTGQSGEYLAASVLQRHFKTIAFPDLAAPYDLVAESYNGDFLRCQVKTADAVNVVNGYRYWRFNTAKKTSCYTNDEIDFFALVCLPRRLLIFQAFENTSAQSRLREDAFTERLELETLNEVLGEHL